MIPNAGNPDFVLVVNANEIKYGSD
jgi:hypothetical protein